jgi:hypothetical protein
MASGIPRRLISELISRWELSKLIDVYVEGVDDQRIIELVKLRTPKLAGCEFSAIAIDAVDVPTDLLKKHDLHSGGAKNRVIALVRELSIQCSEVAVRGVVDRDLDQLVDLDFSSAQLLYTDHNCMEAFFWSKKVFESLLIEYRADELTRDSTAQSTLYDAINEVLNQIAAIRLFKLLKPHAESGRDFKLVEFDKSLTFCDGRLIFDQSNYLKRLGLNAAMARQLKDELPVLLARLKNPDPRKIANGHDLLELLSFMFKKIVSVKRPAPSVLQMADSLFAHGLDKVAWENTELVMRLSQWAGHVKLPLAR